MYDKLETCCEGKEELGDQGGKPLVRKRKEYAITVRNQKIHTKGKSKENQAWGVGNIGLIH